MEAPARVAAGVLLLALAACASGEEAATTVTALTTTAPVPVVSTTTPPTTVASTSSAAATSTTTTTLDAATMVTEPGTYDAGDLVIRLVFRSEVDDWSSAELESTAMGVLNDVGAWGEAGFSFVADPASGLSVVLVEPSRVDELCAPLETRGFASCQNGAVVALNAERWRHATDDWDGSIEEYRRYLVNHEVGHLIGLRHPRERCPAGEARSAVMEPQTAGLVCAGNGFPLEWEIVWASRRPVVVGPLPEWDGPRPAWGG